MAKLNDLHHEWMRSDPDYRTAYIALTEDDMSKTHPCPNPGYCRTHAEWGDVACPICQEEEQEAAYQDDEENDSGLFGYYSIVIGASVGITAMLGLALLLTFGRVS